MTTETLEPFAKAYDEKVRPLMNKIDEVRRYLSPNTDRITFPNVVVVGDQSSGKSSLLEALSLVELPKGTGIVTRCPLVLRLRNSKERKVYRLYEDNQKTLLDEANLNMSHYIEQETMKLAGNRKNVVQKLIEIQIEDPSVRDLTVVDLPGIAYNPVADQPNNIHEQTTNLIRQYIQPEGSLILCVVPANVDVAAVEALLLARRVDPEGKRTVGVITKADLAPDPNTFIEQMLMNRSDVIHLKLGFVAVRNRSSDEKISLEQARAREKEFFSEHPAADAVEQKTCLGIDALIRRLATLYTERVKETFPKMRHEIEAQLKDIHEQESKLPMELRTSAERLKEYNQLVDLYVDTILKAGFKSSKENEGVSIVNMLHKRFKTYQQIIIAQRRELLSNQFRINVQKELSTRSGEELPNFLTSSILKQFIREKLDQLRKVTDQLIDECFTVTRNVLSKLTSNATKTNFLLSKIMNIFWHSTELYLSESKTAVRDQLYALLELDQNEPYTIHTYYMALVEKYQDLSENSLAKSNISSSKTSVLDDDDDVFIFNAISVDDQALKQMLISIYAYWNMLIKRFIEYAALSIRARCIFSVCDDIKQRLREISVKESALIDVYLGDDHSMRSRREHLQKMKERLEKAYRILCEDEKIFVNDKYMFNDMIPSDTDDTNALDSLLATLKTGSDKNYESNQKKR